MWRTEGVDIKEIDKTQRGVIPPIETLAYAISGENTVHRATISPTDIVDASCGIDIETYLTIQEIKGARRRASSLRH